MKNYWISSGIYALLNQVTQMGFNLGVVFILWRAFEPETCAVWVIFITLTAFIEVSRMGLIQNALMTYLNRTEWAEQGRLNTASAALNGFFSTTLVAVLGVSADALGVFFNSPPLSILLKIHCLTLIFWGAMAQLNTIQQAHGDFRSLFWSSLVKNGGFFGYVLFIKMTQQPFELTALVWAQCWVAVPALAVTLWGSRAHWHFEAQLDRVWLKTLFQYGKFTFGTNVATMVYKNIDRMILGKLLINDLSRYDLALKINTLAEVPTLTAASVLFPQSAKRQHTEGGAATKLLYEKSVGILLALLLPVMAVVFMGADGLVWILGADKYAHAADILRVTLFYAPFTAFAVQFGTVIDAMGQPKLNFITTASGAVLALMANIIGIQTLGLYGAAVGNLATMGVMFIVMQTLLRRHLGIRWQQAFIYAFDFYKKLITKGLKGIKEP